MGPYSSGTGSPLTAYTRWSCRITAPAAGSQV